jgi:hypothetical protein
MTGLSLGSSRVEEVDDHLGDVEEVSIQGEEP